MRSREQNTCRQMECLAAKWPGIHTCIHSIWYMIVHNVWGCGTCLNACVCVCVCARACLCAHARVHPCETERQSTTFTCQPYARPAGPSSRAISREDRPGPVLVCALIFRTWHVSHTHTHTHTRAQTHTHTHTHTCMLMSDKMNAIHGFSDTWAPAARL